VKLFGRNSSDDKSPQEITPREARNLQQRYLQLVELGKALITLLQQYRWDIEELKTSRFLRELEDWKNSLELQRSADSLDQIKLKLYERANDHLKQEKTYLDERERELMKMIGLLTEAVSAVSEGSGDYHQEILQSTQKLAEISQLEDIRKMRSMLASEIQSLKETVRQKQFREKEHYDQLSRHVEALQSKLQNAVSRSLLDPLTKLYNRQGWDQELYNACHAASIIQIPFAVSLIDIDNFKHINDDYGHQVGDLVLAKLGAALKDSFRSDDFIARYGGDEIALILRLSSLERAQKRLDRLVKDIAKPTYSCKVDGKEFFLKISISCGVSFFRKEDTAETMLRRADEALYIAKKRGKNQVAAETEMEEESQLI
jgi:diguanylate cyclase